MRDPSLFCNNIIKRNLEQCGSAMPFAGMDVGIPVSDLCRQTPCRVCVKWDAFVARFRVVCWSLPCISDDSGARTEAAA